MATTGVSSSSSSTGTLSSLGVGSGLDVQSIVSKLVALEKQPLTALQNKATVITAQVSEYGKIKSMLATLQDAANKLGTTANWGTKAVSSSNSSAVSATATTRANATSLSVEVQNLAQVQSVATSKVVKGNTVGAGTLSIQLGTFADDPMAASGKSFTAGASGPITINVTAGTALPDVAAQINAAKAGVTATIVGDSTGQRILLQSSATGEVQGFTMDATDSGSLGTTQTALSTLAFNPINGNYGMYSEAGQSTSSIQYAKDANATINGIAVKSATNTLPDSVAGMTLTLSQKTTAPVTINVTQDLSAMKTSVNDFVTAYNAVNDLLNADLQYDPSTKTGSLFQGDSATIGLQNSLRSIVGSITGGGGAFTRLSDIGVSIAANSGGDLAVDSTKLDNAFSNPSAVQALFTANNGSDASNGVGLKFKSFLNMVLGTSGAVATKLASLNTEQKTNTDDQNTVNTRADNFQARLEKQYSTLDAKMASLTSLSTYITQQVAQWNKSSSG